MKPDTEALFQRLLRAQLRELKAKHRERKDREWQQRLDDALARRGYPAPRRGRRR
jgi:hypothetical protein